MAIQNLGLQALSLVTTAILTRILSPSEFGLVAIVLVILTFFGLINQMGWGASLIVKADLTKSIVSTTFWSSVVFGVASATSLIFFAGPLASLFGGDEASELIRTASIVLLVGPPTSVIDSLLLRDYRYRAGSLIKLSLQVIYATATIILALAFGLGVWSIIIGRVISSLAGLILSYAVARPPIGLTFQKAQVVADLPFNAGFISTRIIGHLAKNIDYWAVGRYLGEAQLGIYYIAYVAPNLIRQRMTTAIQATMFPLLSRISDDHERLVRVWLETVQKSLILFAPIMVGLGLVADPIIELMFGAKWTDAAGAMRVIAIATIVEVVVVLTGSVFAALGKPHLGALGNAVRLLVIGVLAVPAAQWRGIEGMALTVLAGTVAIALLSFWMMRRETGARAVGLISAIRPTILPLAAMIFIALIATPLLGATNPLVELLAPSLTGAAAYLGTGFALHRDSFAATVTDIRRLLLGVRAG